MVRSALAAISLFAVLAVARGGSGDYGVSLQGITADTGGRLFASSDKWHEQLGLREDDRWQMIPLAAQPDALLALRDGRIAVLGLHEKKWMLMIVAGNTVTQRVELPWQAEPSPTPSVMLEDSRGAIWISGRSGQVVRVDLPGLSFQLFDFSPTTGSQPRWNRVMVTEDGRGAIWVWCHDGKSAAFSGAYRIEGSSSTLVGNVGEERLMALLPRDHDTLWVGGRASGLSILHLDTLAVEKVRPPGMDTFVPVTMMEPFGSGWLVIGGPEMTMWKLDQDRWTKITTPEISGFTAGYWSSEPAYAQLKSGALYGLGKGLLFVPREGSEARMLDWGSGFALTGLRQILPIAGDRFAVTSESKRSPRWMEGDLEEVLHPRPNSVRLFRSRGWAVDAEDRIFAILEGSQSTLSICENGRWRELPLPSLENASFSEADLLAVDARSRLWVMSRKGKGDSPVAVLSSDHATWKTFSNLHTALSEYREDLSGLLKEHPLWQPMIGPGGTIAYCSFERWIFFFDGRNWRWWAPGEVGRGATFGDRLGRPFFDAQGGLCVNTERGKETWKLQADGAWKEFPKIDNGTADLRDGTSPVTNHKLPPGFHPSSLSGRVVQDNHGLTWVAGDGNLYKYYRGKTVPVFKEGSVHPLLANPKLLSVRGDRFGYTWLELEGGGYVMLPPPVELPPKLALKVDRDGCARITEQVTGTVEWRLDGGAWQALPASSALGFLPPGRHKVETIMVNSGLDVFSQVLDVEVEAKGQVQRLIQILESGPPELRDMAVEGLSRQGNVAIPALKERLAQTDQDPWWLQAALQECERAGK